MASFTCLKYFKGWHFPKKYAKAGRVIIAWIARANNIIHEKGRSAWIPSVPLVAVTLATMANTPRGVSLITNIINFKIAVLSAENISPSNLLSDFLRLNIAIHRTIPIKTICIAFTSNID
jgi:hypothetical protein